MKGTLECLSCGVIDVNSIGTADMKVPVRFGWKAGTDRTLKTASHHIFPDEVLQVTPTLGGAAFVLVLPGLFIFTSRHHEFPIQLMFCFLFRFVETCFHARMPPLL